MPKVLEVACENQACDVDMFSIHYEHFVPDDEFDDEYGCPSCGERGQLRPLGV